MQYELLRAGLADLEVALEKGLLEIDDDGSVRLPAIRAMDEEPELRRTNQFLSESIGTTQLPDIILEIDSHIVTGRENFTIDFYGQTDSTCAFPGPNWSQLPSASTFQRLSCVQPLAVHV